MKLEKSTISIGLDKPVKLLHVTDSHLTLTDKRDDESKRALSGRMGELSVNVDTGHTGFFTVLYFYGARLYALYERQAFRPLHDGLRRPSA